MILHLVNKSPFQHSALNDALPLVSAKDSLLLLDDAVYAALAGSSFMASIKATGCGCYVLKDNAQARGLNSIDPACTPITMDEMVDLVFKADKTLGWF